jgi:L-lysine exporter family protein LysE/ArgO
MSTNSQALTEGFILYAGLIIALGPQNLYLVRQGLNRSYLFTTVMVSSVANVLLVSLGIGGLGTVIATSKPLLLITTLGGGVFLLAYALRSFHSAWHGQGLSEDGFAKSASLTFKSAILAALSFSLLNPAAYVDTLLIVGTTSGRYAIDERILFGLGAAMASCVWFFTLTYGSSRLSPLFNRTMAWRALDMVSGCIMVNLGVSLFTTQSALLW